MSTKSVSKSKFGYVDSRGGKRKGAGRKTNADKGLESRRNGYTVALRFTDSELEHLVQHKPEDITIGEWVRFLMEDALTQVNAAMESESA